MVEVFSLSRTDRLDLPPSFSASEWFDGSPGRALFAPFGPLVDRVLALPALERLYRQVPKDERTFWDRALAAMDIEYDVPASDAANIPFDGPLIVVANHPHGGLDGLILASLLTRVRPDVKLIGNGVLSRIPELRRSLVSVDPFGRNSSIAANAAAMRKAMEWLQDGGALAVFPAGEVSHRAGLGEAIADPEWAASVARLARRASAAAIPVFIDGGNSALFNAAGWLHPRLRTVLLVRELLKQRGRRIRVRVGKAIPAARLQSFNSARAATEYFRLRTYALADRPARSRVSIGDGNAERVPLPPLAPPEDPQGMSREIDALDSVHTLLTSGPYTLLLASAAEIPSVLREVGRLRESAFRAAGEGSGLSRDIDRFDEHYLHLVLWNHQRSEVVGAYRIGQTDVILEQRGIDGLYTSTLFRYQPQLLDEIGPALELGRAFVRTEYQRDYSPLLLLWRGIGTFIARNPRYRRLFGTVSISSDYQSLSQQILARFLHTTSYRDDLAQFVEPRNPPAFLGGRRPGKAPSPADAGLDIGPAKAGRDGAPLGLVVRTVAEVGALLAEIESDGKGVPVLLRQYLKLNAKLLGFNVDPAFGGVLDGLMMVDLMNVERELLVRYLGRDGAQHFIEQRA